MDRSSYLLILGGILSFCGAIFQVVIAIVPTWSAAFGAGEALVSNPPLLLALGVLVGLLLVIFGLYGLSGAGVIRRLPLLRLGLFVIGLLYCMVGIKFRLPGIGDVGDPAYNWTYPDLPSSHIFRCLSRRVVVLGRTGGKLESALNQACSSSKLREKE